MSTGTPGRPRSVATTKAQSTTSDIISKYFLPFAAGITTAIFYYSGWVYVAHWYGFYGIDASQMNVPLQLILIHGIPGILLLVICGALAVTIQSAYAIIKKIKLSAVALPFMLLYAAILAYTIIEYFASKMPYPNDIPMEVVFSSKGFNLIIGIAVTILILAGFGVTFRSSFSTNAVFFATLSLVLIYYFFISISTSALLGEWDAARGNRLMVGNWQVPRVAMYSTTPISTLSTIENKISDTEYQYSPLGLIGNDDHVYYLVEWKTEMYYPLNPKVYIAPRSDALQIAYLINSPDEKISPPRTIYP